MADLSIKVPNRAIEIGATAEAGGTWYYATSHEADQLLGNSSYVGASAVTIGEATNATAIAIKVWDAGNATQFKLGIYPATGGNVAAIEQGTATPVSGDWCIVAISQTLTANATYLVGFYSNGTTGGGYGDAGLGTGYYDVANAYASELSSRTWGTGATDTWAAAICTGGTPGTPR